MVTLQLCAKDGEGSLGLPKLRSAEVMLNYDFESDWAPDVLYDAPVIDDLTFSVCQPENMLRLGLLLPQSHARRMPRLKRLVFYRAKLCMEGIMTILANSRQTLHHLSVDLADTAGWSTWKDLVTCLSEGFEGPTGGRKVRFHQLDRTVPKELQSGLNLIWKGRPRNRWISGVSYQGAKGRLVLSYAAASMYVVD